jgi:hypothetical protein
MSESLAAAGINIGVAVAQVVGGSFSALFGFANQADATRAAALLKKATTTGKETAKRAAPRAAAARPAAAKPASRKPASRSR